MNKDKILHDLFITSIIIKGIDGTLEFLGGLTLILVKSNSISDIVQTVFQHELTQDPTDLIANYLIETSQALSISTISFMSIYLLIHGAIKMGLFTGLWYRKAWIYPLAGILLSLFVTYQFIRFFHTHSIVLLFLTSIDLLIIILLKFEHKRQLSLQNSSRSST